MHYRLHLSGPDGTKAFTVHPVTDSQYVGRWRGEQVHVALAEGGIYVRVGNRENPDAPRYHFFWQGQSIEDRLLYTGNCANHNGPWPRCDLFAQPPLPEPVFARSYTGQRALPII
jgi:hypothetical protein